MHDVTQVATGFVRPKTQDFFRPPSENGAKKKKSILGFLSASGGLRGRNAESKAEKAWAPKWKNRRRYGQVFKKIRLATREEDDVLKWDIVFETFIPKYPLIGVQIKTSLDHYQKFEEKHPDVPVVYLSVFDQDSPPTIRKKMMFMMHYKIPDLAQEMAKLGCQVSPKILQQIADIDPGQKFILI